MQQQLRIAIYSKVAKETVSRWLRVRADIRPRFNANAVLTGGDMSGGVVPMTLFSPPFYSLSKLNTTMMAKGIFQKDPVTGLIKITVDAKDYLMREDGPAVRPPLSAVAAAAAAAAAAAIAGPGLASSLPRTLTPSSAGPQQRAGWRR